MTREPNEPYQCFSTTIWSLVGRASHGNDEQQKQALDQLVRRYRPALCAHLIHRWNLQGHSAEDLLQQFLLNKIVEREILNKVVPRVGKFRYFLLRSLDRFCVSAFRHERTRARFTHGAVPIDQAIEEAEEAAEPQNVYDVAWARQLLSSTIESMRNKCQSSGRLDVWDVCQGRLLDPLLHGAAPVPYDELVARHGLVSPGQAANLLVTAKRMFRKALRDLIAEYEPNEAMVDEEVADLLRILSGGNANVKEVTG
jgi:DNA-directed RNA polymerase specialized sigma24 family protein